MVATTIERVEDVVYVLIAVMLIAAAVFLFWNVITTGASELSHGSNAQAAVVTILDKGLSLFIVVELLYTVRITIRDRSLAAEPFLIVGLIAGIRRVLILTAQTSFSWQREGVQLLTLLALIVVMGVAILAWRASEARRPLP